MPPASVTLLLSGNSRVLFSPAPAASVTRSVLVAHHTPAHTATAAATLPHAASVRRRLPKRKPSRRAAARGSNSPRR